MKKRFTSLILASLMCVLMVIALLWCMYHFAASTGPFKPAQQEQVSLDLLAEVSRADFIEDTTQILFGTTSGKAHYEEADLRYHEKTEGWLSWKNEEKDADCAVLVGGRAGFRMNRLDPAACTLVLKGCAAKGGKGDNAKINVFLNKRLLGKGVLPRGEKPFTLRFEVPAKMLETGSNFFCLEIEEGVKMTLPGYVFPMTVSAFFVSALLEGTHSAATEGLLSVAGKSGSRSLLLQPAGTIINFYHMPGSEESLRTTASAKGAPLRALIRVAGRDGSMRECFLESLSPGEAPVDVDIDLSELKGQASRITFFAGSPGHEKSAAFVSWEAPRVVRVGVKESGKQEAEELRSKDRTAGPGTGEAGSLRDKKPNMVVILLDAASAFFFDCCEGRWSSEKGTAAPASDRLAIEAVVFQRAVTPAPYTLPAVGSLMTGLLPDRHGVVMNATRNGTNVKLSEGCATLAAVLKRAGYHTLAVVTNPNAASLYGYGKGFDRFDELFSDPELWDEGVKPGDAVIRAKDLILKCREKKRGGPFFLYLHLFQPHAPYAPPEPFMSRFAESGSGSSAVQGSRAVLDGFKKRGVPGLGPEDFERLKELYAANLSWADHAVAGFLDWMRSTGLYEGSLIVLCSDHGEAFGEHSSIEHGHHLYEEALRVPLVIKYPGRAFMGRKVKEVVSLVDLAPTLAAAAGLPPGFPGTRGLGADGADLTAALDRGLPWKERAHMARSDVFKPSYSLRWRGYQYIYDTLNRREELYYLPDDPRQIENIVESDAIVAGYLRAELSRLLDSLAAEKAGEAVDLNEEFIQSIEEIGYTGGVGSRKHGRMPDMSENPIPGKRH